jgi:hypothetical protein
LTNGGFPEDLLELVADTSTQKTVFHFSYSGIQLDFTIPQTFRELIGFESRLVPLAATTGVVHEYSDNIARFNSINYYMIHTDLVSRGIRKNGQYTQTIAQVLIRGEPGSQVIDTPFNPPGIPCQELAGSNIRKINLWLTDDRNNLVDTLGEEFSTQLTIHYFM